MTQIDNLVRRIVELEQELAAKDEALREIADWDDDVEAEDCPRLRGIARAALTAQEDKG